MFDVPGSGVAEVRITEKVVTGTDKAHYVSTKGEKHGDSDYESGYEEDGERTVQHTH